MSSSNGAALVNTDVVRERRDLELSGGSVTINGGGESRGLSGSSSGTCWESVSPSSSSKSSSSKSNSSPIVLILGRRRFGGRRGFRNIFQNYFPISQRSLLTCDVDAADGRAVACISYLHHIKKQAGASKPPLFFCGSLSGFFFFYLFWNSDFGETDVACSCGWS